MIDIALLVIAALVLLPMAVLVVECLVALLPVRARPADQSPPRPAVAVLVPAHNEEAVIGVTLSTIRPQLQPCDRLVVVADNCDDGTAAVARAAGVTALERSDQTRRGKGYALEFGVRFLEQDPPAAVILMDADCTVFPGTVERLAQQVAATGRPVQARYEMDVPPGGGVRDQLSAFAFQFKNTVRPLGMARLGLPCLLTGTGMAFPWPVLRDAPLGSANIVEDMQLGLDLAVAGHPPKLCADAVVTGQLPTGKRAATTQRTRWEHGHVQTLQTQVPRLLRAAVRQRRVDLLGLALELSVPPLSMLFLIWAAVLSASGVWWAVGGSAWPAVLLTAGALAVLLSIFLAWTKFGRDRLPLASLLAAPFYVMWKVPIYLAFLFRRQKAWVRTERTTAPPTDA